jgi:hypothetical protein
MAESQPTITKRFLPYELIPANVLVYPPEVMLMVSPKPVFEQVPLEVIKKIVKTGEKLQKGAGSGVIPCKLNPKVNVKGR